MRLLFDIENNGLLKETTKIHCICATDIDTEQQVGVWGPHEIPAALEVLDKADVLIGHNIQSHDIPVMTKLNGFRPRAYPALLDTYISSRVIYPNLMDTDGDLVNVGRLPKHLRGKHSLEAWGYRTGERKAAYAGGWDEWSQEMQDYMVQDAASNMAFWRKLKVDAYPQPPIELEHRIAFICDSIEDEGVPFAMAKARVLHMELRGKLEVSGTALKSQFGAWYKPATPAKAVFTPKVTSATNGYTAGAPLTKLKLVHFNPGSRDHIAAVLTKRGWKPSELTDTGKPKINEQVVANIMIRYPEMAELGSYLMLKKRISQLADGEQAWMKAMGADGRIHGAINPMGTTTSRGAHMHPNLGQVPAAASPYGHECRDLFHVPKGWKLIGADASGLELRGLSHYLYPYDQGAYGEMVLTGDVHWANTLAMGLATGARDKTNALHTIMREQGAKTFIYAFIYGAGDAKAGEIVLNACLQAQRQGFPEPIAKFFGDGVTDEEALKRVGKKIKRQFLKGITGFDELKKKLTRQCENFHWVPGLDGRRIPVRSDHSALNFLIQSAGAIICKRWLCDAWDDLSSRWPRGWNGDWLYILWVHDEVQVACRDDKRNLAEQIGAILTKHAKAAGEPYGFRIKLDSEYKIGMTWAETH